MATPMNLSPQQIFAKSLKTYQMNIEKPLPHIPHGTNFGIPEDFIDFVAYDKGKNEPETFI